MEQSVEVVTLTERFELPEIALAMTQHRRLAVHCPICGPRVVGLVPVEAGGRPFSPRLHAEASYLKTEPLRVSRSGSQ